MSSRQAVRRLLNVVQRGTSEWSIRQEVCGFLDRHIAEIEVCDFPDVADIVEGLYE